MAVPGSAIKAITSNHTGNQLQTFVWNGTDKRGVKIKGEQLAKNASLLRAELRRQGISPGTVKLKPKPLLGGAGSRIKAKDIAFFSRQMATMMKSGVPIVSTLEIIGSGHKNPRMKKLVNTVRTDIEGGSSLYEAVAWKPCWTPLPPTRKTPKP
jgi:type IV pilus assembly protein PilC